MSSVRAVGVIDKTMAVLRALGNGPHDLAALQRATGLPRATAHRLAVALEDHGMVRRDPAGRFLLGYELVRLGRQAGDALAIVDIAQPVLDDLAATTREGVQLYVREAAFRRCVLSFESTHGLRWIVPLGALLPLDKGSAGRVLADGRAIAESVEEREPGAASVSAAVVDVDGVVVGAVCISGPVERLSRSPLTTFGEAVRVAAAEISQRLAATR